MSFGNLEVGEQQASALLQARSEWTDAIAEVCVCWESWCLFRPRVRAKRRTKRRKVLKILEKSSKVFKSLLVTGSQARPKQPHSRASSETLKLDPRSEEKELLS